MTSSLCFLNLSIKPAKDNLQHWKLCRLIFHLKFYKICKFESHVTRNDVIMMSLPKTMENNGKCGPRRNQIKYISLERFWWEPFKNVIFIEFEPLCQSKVMGIYVKFTKTTRQIWWCHVTLASNFENFYLSHNSVLNFRKSYQIWEKLTQEQKRYGQKTNWGWKSLVLIGLNCGVSHEKSSSASFFTTAKVTSQILLDQASHA